MYRQTVFIGSGYSFDSGLTSDCKLWPWNILLKMKKQSMRPTLFIPHRSSSLFTSWPLVESGVWKCFVEGYFDVYSTLIDIYSWVNHFLEPPRKQYSQCWRWRPQTDSVLSSVSLEFCFVISPAFALQRDIKRTNHGAISFRATVNKQNVEFRNHL